MKQTEDFSKATAEAAKAWLDGHPRPEARAGLLKSAIMSSRPDLVRLLLREGLVDVDQPVSAEFRPLYLAVENYEPEIVEALCRHGADPNLTTDDGWTALHLAVDVEADSAHQEERAPSTGLLDLLLAAGADSTLRDTDGRTPYDLAVEWAFTAAIDLLDPST